MAHVKKFTAGSVNGLAIHFDRKTENHANQDIDNTRSHLNVDLRNHGDELDTRSRFEQRLSEVYCLNRADVKPLAVWVVTLPETLEEQSDQAQQKFFRETYAFLAERYGGEKNVISANVHMDESTPHMHFAFMPIVWDAKKQLEKVSAKLVLNRQDLRTFHQELDGYLKEKIPTIYQTGILNEQTIGIEDVKSLKKHSETIQEMKREMNRDVAQLEMKKERLKQAVVGIPLFDTKQLQAETKRVGLLRKEEVPTGNFLVTPEQVQTLSKRLSGIKCIQETQKELMKQEKRLNEREEKLDRFNERLVEKEGKLYQKEENSHHYEANLLEKADWIDHGQKWKAEKAQFQKKVTQLEKENSFLRDALDKVNELYEGLKLSFRNVAQAVGLLKYSDGEYKQELNNSGSRLIDAVSNYTSRWLRKMGNEDLAEEVDKTVGVSKGIQEDIQDLEPKRTISRGHELGL